MDNTDSTVISAGAQIIQQPLLSSGDPVGVFDWANQFQQMQPSEADQYTLPAVINTFKDSFIHWCKLLKLKIRKTADGKK